MLLKWALEYGSVGDGKRNAPNDHKLAQKPQARPKTTKTAKNHKLAQKTTSQTKNHKLAQKPQRRQKTTSSPKNHKPDKKPQARQKTTKTAKNHNRAPFAVFERFVGAVRFAHGIRIKLCFDALARGFWRLFPFLTRNALRAIQKPQARPKTTSSPKNHKDGKKPQSRAFCGF